MCRALSRLLPFALPLLLAAGAAHARSATATIDRVDSAIATLDDVRVDLSWPEGAASGELRLRARRAVAPALGYDFRDLDWRCDLRRNDDAWQCAGELRSGGGRMQLSVSLGDATRATLSRGRSRIDLRRDAASPDLTRINLVEVPLAWTQALLARAWPTGRITGGSGDAALAIRSPDDGPLRIAGPVELHAAGFDTPDGTVAGEGIGARLYVDARLGDTDAFTVEGRLLGGEMLFGTTYISLQKRPVELLVDAVQDGDGWMLPRLAWHDEGILAAEGSAALGPEATLRSLDLRLRSPDLAPLATSYLGGWLGVAGFGGATLEGSADAHVRLADGKLGDATLILQGAGFDDPDGRFAFEGLDGDVRFSSGAPVGSELRWRGGALYGLPLGAASVPLRSSEGALALAAPVELPILGGHARLEHLRLRPPGEGAPTDLRFGLALEGLDVGQLSSTLGWPGFAGELSGNIPQARYADEVLKFDGGLSMQLFGGSVSVTSLAMERPFGVLPTLSADVALDDIGLMDLTGAFDFGSISGKLDGRIDGLRLVDWTPVAFDAWLATERHAGVRQRISQRAVQDLSSVGNGSFVGSLQAQLIGFFDDFGYSRIGIGCRLVDEVCTMDGLGSAGEGFIIVRGSGLPRLTVVGFNRRVDWPTLVERLAAIGSGDIKPVVD